MKNIPLSVVGTQMQEINDAWKELRHIALMRNVKLAVAFFVLNIIDAALTVVAVDKGGYELLPIARYLLGQSPWGFWTFKAGMALLFIFTLLILSDRYPHRIHRIFLILVSVMAGICLFNAIGIL